MNLRLFQPNDQSVVAALINNGLSEYWANFEPSYNPDVLDIQGSYVDQGHEVWLLEDGGEIIACGVLKVYEDGTGEIVRMSVDRERRREGIGRFLLTHLIKRANLLNLASLIVETNANWLGAIALYEQAGFVEYKREQNFYDEPVTEIYICLPLKP